jgi:hypothetical protein
MDSTTTVTREVQSLIEAVCDGVADDAQVRELDCLLLADERTCNFYVDMLDLDAKLQRLVGSLPENDEALAGFVAASRESQEFPTPTFPSLFHSALAYFSDGMPLAYILATVITGLGLLVMGLVHVSGPEEVAKGVAAPVVEPRAEYVGKITGASDCKWEKEGAEVRGQGSGANNQQSTINNHQSLVSLGQKFALASGLLEISYNTGAKVILQGPVTYEVESNGGFLSLGKLTGRLRKRNDEARMTNDEGLQKSSFVIRTPTATVTDLGTEFGVEVSGRDSTKVCVFVGEVQVETAHQKSRRLTAQQAVQVTAGEVRRVPSGSVAKTFVRTIRSTVSANGSFSDNFAGRPSRHWINPQVASYVGGRALFDKGWHYTDRIYLYTAGDCNYAAHDFAATVKITNAFGAAGSAFFGLGDAHKSGFFDEPGAAPPFVYFMYQGSGYTTSFGAVRTSSDDRATHLISAIGAQPSGTTITARFEWAATSRTATFSIDANNDGVYDATVTTKCPDFVVASDTFAPSRLFIGGSGGASFSDFSVTIGPRQPGESGGAAAEKPVEVYSLLRAERKGAQHVDANGYH